MIHKTSHQTHGKRHAYQWPIVIMLGLAALFLGCIGFWKQPVIQGESRSFLDVFHYALQLFVLHSSHISHPISWELEVARILAPAVGFYTVIQTVIIILFEQSQLFCLRLARNHTVICGLGRKGLQLVRDFKNHRDCVVAIEKDGNSDHIRVCKELGAIVLVGDATDKKLLHKARIHLAENLIAICGDDGTNVEIAIHAHDLVKERRMTIEGTVRCYVHIHDLELRTMFKNHTICKDTSSKLKISIRNIYDNNARLLFQKYHFDYKPIMKKTDLRTVHLIIAGFGQMGESVLLQAAKIGHYANEGNTRKLHITVIDREANRKKKAVYRLYPQLDQICTVDFHEIYAEDVDMLEKIIHRGKDANSIKTMVVCFDNDSHSLSFALSMLSKYEKCMIPIFIRMGADAGLAKLLKTVDGESHAKDSIHAFGMVDLACTRDMLLMEKQDTLAKAIHEEYVKKRKLEKTKPETDPSMQPWALLDEEYKDSNRQQADHIPVKLRAIGCYKARPEKGAPEENKQPVSSFTNEEVELMARMEHARWNAERLLAGWVYAPGERGNVENKTSPFLVDWKELPENIKPYDRDTVRKIPYFLNLIGEKIYR